VIQPGSRLASLSLRSSSRPGLGYRLLVLFLAGSPWPLHAAAAQPPPAAASTVSLAEYRARLQSLDQLIVACQRAMTPANCQSDQVGPDLKLALPSGTRQVRFAWLRELLVSASKDQAAKVQIAKDKTAKDKATKDKTAQAPKAPNQSQPAPARHQPEFHRPALVQQLEDARQRLAAEHGFAAELAGEPIQQSAAQAPGKPATNPSVDSSPQRQTLTRILAAKEYHAAVARPSLMHQLLEKVGNWLDRFIAKLQQAGFRSRWVGLAAEIGFGILICVALAWFLIRLERRGRFTAASLRPEPASGAVSARDWQLWLEDAGKAAAQGAWRDGIHFLYWASIARLESGGLWPADRARTPREYLALLSGKSAQRADLAALTRSFERTWYAGRPAAEADFHQAEQVAAQLGARQTKPISSTPQAGEEAQ
jgi:hypothetical protein